MSLFYRVADYRNPNSLASRLRQRRLVFFQDLLARVPKPVSLLDVGGTAAFWKTLGAKEGAINITLLNVKSEETGSPFIVSTIGDARDLHEYADKSIDIVYSNSVIEHVGAFEDQRRMAQEMQRVGKRYFMQTPNKYFPIEPHFLVPGYQFMPLALKTFLLTKARLGWTERERDWQTAEAIADSVRLLTPTEVRTLFPTATITNERFAGLIKSVIAYDGWA
jgi:hypothetical protein